MSGGDPSAGADGTTTTITTIVVRTPLVSGRVVAALGLVLLVALVAVVFRWRRDER